MGKIRLASGVMYLVLTGLCLLVLSCTTGQSSSTTTDIPAIPSDDPLAVSRQSTVTAFHSLPSGYEGPEITGPSDFASPRLEGWFDANEYFSVLHHLSMQPGYTLDYVYYNSGSGAQPYLYARQIDSKPFNTLGELEQAYLDTSKDHRYDYLALVHTDDTEESFFQYAVLRVMGGQFYLWWHANYNDHTIICDHTRLAQILNELAPGASSIGQTMPPEIQQAARSLDLAPKVELNNETVTVRVVIFTKWGGFIEEIYTDTRAFPHVITDVKTNTLVPWDIGITF